MSAFSTVLVTDSRIADITSDLEFAVQMGGSQNTGYSFAPTSATNSSITAQINIPSENIIVDRKVTIRSTINFTVNVGNSTTGGLVPIGDLAFDLGLRDAPQSFPLNRLFTTSQATVNNCSVSQNVQDIMDSLLRMNNSRELYRYNSTTPSYVDSQYANYAQAVGANNNPLASYSNASYDIDQLPRGAYPVTISNVDHYVGGVLTDADLTSTATTDYWVIQCQITVEEPILCLSPFTYTDSEYGSAGLVGINTISFNFSLDSSCKRFWSTAYNYGGPYSVSLGWNGQSAFSNTFFNFVFLSSQPSQLISAKNVVQYWDTPRYLTNSNGTPQIQPYDPVTNTGSTVINSNTLQLSCIPDYFIVTVRIPMSQQTPQNSSSFFTITSCSINLNNSSGLLSSYTTAQLWAMSSANGSNQNFLEWRGQAQFNNPNGEGTPVGTTGSVLVINPAIDLSLPNYLSNNSIGQFQFQIQLNVINNYAVAIQPEIVVVCCNSGLFISEQGQSSTFISILGKELVLNTAEGKEVPEISRGVYNRMLGGSMLNRHPAKHAKHHRHHAHKRHGHHAHHMMGGAISGGAISQGSSGGMIHHVHHKSKLHKHLR